MDGQYYNAFNLIPGTGPVKFKKLLAFFGNIEKAWHANTNELTRSGLPQEWIQKFLDNKQRINPTDEYKKLLKKNIKAITISDNNYPARLKQIYDPPHVLYVKGKIIPEDEFAIGIVGSRKISIYGQQVTPDLSVGLSSEGLTIVSGLARGIDTLAHQSTLEAGGRTIAVIGSRLDRQNIYPPQNQKLAEKIATNGAVVSEFPIGTKAMPYHFPLRNRIISGLSLGVLLIEAEEKSGALITAEHALAQNREVFAVPGSIYWPTSAGTNKLIKRGAKLVQNTYDIMEELNLQTIPKAKEPKIIFGASAEENVILNCLCKEPTHIDKIIKMAKLEASVVNAILLEMELKGRIKNLGGLNYIKK
ncbi:MAG: DNA-protecting protein DprA [Candidatus Portnoybacteria bacterium CG10_big_fil_rev_8_21_14_0_10_36_7]|uniref:DNA-protecting protein DprA n=1 Tax=Candidatus Portnoybacteria bacterium CG10_big_fil_rev_8_21_14_0_10_36_7 TaxID=1974812 RepID=A0A2M8KE83_9BACT|nr:MAG: DNA-protecting protein DprA [Candidatus Portnoybacteria bacterium CG10_big_fil_rev_8_21_14_0_10_36_7]